MAKNNNQHLAEATSIKFMVMPLWRLFLLCFFTLGLYSIFWFYKNWQAVKQAEQANIWPFWRAMFTIFWIYPLFKKVSDNNSAAESAVSYQPGYLAMIYIITSIVGSTSSRADNGSYSVNIGWAIGVTVGLFVVNLLPLVATQSVINASTDNDTLGHQVSYGENMIIAVGVALFLLTVAVLRTAIMQR